MGLQARELSTCDKGALAPASQKFANYTQPRTKSCHVLTTPKANAINQIKPADLPHTIRYH